MNLDGLRAKAERLLRRSPSEERKDAMYALSGKTDVVARRRYVRLSKVDVACYLAPNENLHVHHSLLPRSDYWETNPGRIFGWQEWTVLSVDRIGPDCVRLIVPGVGSMPVPVVDFVDAVLKNNVKEPPHASPA